MVIRDEQLDQLAASRKDDFIERLMDHFRRVHPDDVAALGTGYRDWTLGNVSDAERIGLRTEQQVARFVNLCFVWGKGFVWSPGHRWAREIATDPERAPHLKIHQLVYETRMRRSQ